jgi:uncharacterized protein
VELQRNNEQLKAIRRGDWTVDYLREWFSRKQTELERVYSESKLRQTPDLERIRSLLLSCLEDHYGSLESCVVDPNRAVAALKNVQAELEKVRDLL